MEKILSKIQALLEKSVENGCTQAESELAASKAAELMIKYGIESRQLNQQTEISHKETKAVESWKVILGAGVAKCCFCFCFTRSLENKLIFVGTKDELEACQELYQWLAMQIVFLAAEEGLGKVATREFCLGIALKVAKRLQEKFGLTVQEYSSGSEIVRKSNEENKNYVVETLGVTLQPGKALKRKESDAFKRGIEVGNKVNLDNHKSVAGQKALA